MLFLMDTSPSSFVCSKCGKTKVEDDFGIDRRRTSGRKCACRECLRSYNLEWARANPPRSDQREQHAFHNAKRFTELRTKGLCQNCRVNPIGERSKIYCDECRKKKTTQQITRALDQRKGRLCPGRCGNRVFGYRAVLCEECKRLRDEARRVDAVKYTKKPARIARQRAYSQTPEVREIRAKQMRDYRLAQKLKCYEAYGGARCACCGETELFFLSMDHLNNNGTWHKKEARFSHLILWLAQHNFPPGYRVLCMNCNVGRHRNGGICPHEVMPPKTEEVFNLEPDDEPIYSYTWRLR